MLSIRLAALGDIKEVFNLSNDKNVRRNSIHNETIIWEDHIKWFNEKISSYKDLFYIFEIDNEFLGYCRLDKKDEEWVISIAIKEDFRNKGYGKQIIKKVCKLNNEKDITAYVKKSNQSSLQMFLACNFQKINEKTIENKPYLIFKKVKSI